MAPKTTIEYLEQNDEALCADLSIDDFGAEELDRISDRLNNGIEVLTAIRAGAIAIPEQWRFVVPPTEHAKFKSKEPAWVEYKTADVVMEFDAWKRHFYTAENIAFTLRVIRATTRKFSVKADLPNNATTETGEAMKLENGKGARVAAEMIGILLNMGLVPMDKLSMVAPAKTEDTNRKAPATGEKLAVINAPLFVEVRFCMGIAALGAQIAWHTDTITPEKGYPESACLTIADLIGISVPDKAQKAARAKVIGQMSALITVVVAHIDFAGAYCLLTDFGGVRNKGVTHHRVAALRVPRMTVQASLARRLLNAWPAGSAFLALWFAHRDNLMKAGARAEIETSAWIAADEGANYAWANLTFCHQNPTMWGPSPADAKVYAQIAKHSAACEAVLPYVASYLRIKEATSKAHAQPAIKDASDAPESFKCLMASTAAVDADPVDILASLDISGTASSSSESPATVYARAVASRNAKDEALDMTTAPTVTPTTITYHRTTQGATDFGDPLYAIPIPPRYQVDRATFLLQEKDTITEVKNRGKEKLAVVEAINAKRQKL